MVAQLSSPQINAPLICISNPKPKWFREVREYVYGLNSLGNRQIAARLEELSEDALAEEDYILVDSALDFTQFFIEHPSLIRPKITLTPDNTLSVRWIYGAQHFFAIEFTGKLMVKVIAEVPLREPEKSSRYFENMPLNNILSFASGIGTPL